MKEHAKLSASSAHRWLNCPGSVAAEHGVPDAPSAFAEEGTQAHRLVEGGLKSIYHNDRSVLKSLQKELPSSVIKEIEINARVYFEYIENARLEISKNEKPMLFIEEKVDYSNWVPGGFGTIDALLISEKFAIVIDFKYGQGVRVYAKDNPQLKLYALGVIQSFSWLVDIERVRTAIVQPRISKYVDFVEYSREELFEFGEKIRPIANQALNGPLKFKAGTWCQFCKANATCKGRTQDILEKLSNIGGM